MTQITMPKLSDSMSEGTILSWLIGDGRPVAVGDELVEIETDKATMTYEAEAAGTLSIVAEVGSTVSVGAPIARLGEAAAGVPAVADVDGAAPAAAAAPAAKAPEGVPAAAAAPNGAAATPLARRAARAHGVALDSMAAGSGPRGRVTRADVLRAAGIAVPPPTAAPAPAVVAPPAPAPAPAPLAARAAPPAGVAVRELTRLQQVVARRMTESKATVPHFQVQTEVALDAVLALRARLKQAARADSVVPSLNDIVVKAAALALRRHPLANASFRDDRFELHEQVNVGIAVAAADALVVPTIKQADVKSVGQIAREARALADRVRDGAATPEDLDGGTFTVSNLGMFGMTAIWPVVNMPQAAILGVGAARETLARVDGEIVGRTLLTLTLSCDHRILYGADAARFLAEIARLLEQPLALAL